MIFFVDESGHPHPKDSVGRPVLGSIGFPLSRSREISGQLHTLKRDAFGDLPPEAEKHYKANAILNEHTYRRFREKWEYVEQVVDLAVGIPVVSLFIVMHRPKSPIQRDQAQLPLHIRFLLERIEGYMNNERGDRKAIVMFDSQDHTTDRRISTAITNFLFRHAEGRAWTHILETPCFADSSITPGTQIADYFVSIIRQYYEITEGEQQAGAAYARSIERLHGVIERTVYTYSTYSGEKRWGEYRLPPDALEAPPEVAPANEAASNEEGPDAAPLGATPGPAR